MKALYYLIILAMLALALLCYEYKGIFIIEGALAGAGFALARTIQRKKDSR